MKTKIVTGTLALAALFTLGADVAQADKAQQNRGEGNGMYEMRQKGDASQMRERFENRAELTDDQKSELAELREDGDKDAMREKMAEFGITTKGPDFLSELTDTQRETLAELHENADKEAIQEQLEEWGIETPQVKKMAALEDVLDADEIDALEEAHETIRSIMDDNKDKLEDAGIKGFFARVGGFFKGLFK